MKFKLTELVLLSVTFWGKQNHRRTTSPGKKNEPSQPWSAMRRSSSQKRTKETPQWSWTGKITKRKQPSFFRTIRFDRSPRILRRASNGGQTHSFKHCVTASPSTIGSTTSFACPSTAAVPDQQPCFMVCLRFISKMCPSARSFRTSTTLCTILRSQPRSVQYFEVSRKTPFTVRSIDTFVRGEFRPFLWDSAGRHHWRRRGAGKLRREVPLHERPHRACFVFCADVAGEHFDMERRGHNYHRRRGIRTAVALPPGIGFQIPRPIL